MGKKIQYERVRPYERGREVDESKPDKAVFWKPKYKGKY